MIGLKRSISVQIANYVKVKVANTFIPGVERVNLTGEVALCALGHAEKFDPRMSCCIGTNHLIGAVC